MWVSRSSLGADPHTVVLETSPIVALFYGDPAALELQEQPLHVLQKIVDGVDVGVAIVLVLGWVVTGLVSLPAFLCPHRQGELSSILPIPLYGR